MASIRNVALFFAIPVFLVACTSLDGIFQNTPSVKQIYYKDGKVAYLTSCKGWSTCLDAIGTTCKEAGYTILEQGHHYSENVDIVFACNKQP